MAEPHTVDSPDAARTLGVTLYEFSPQDRRRGAFHHRSGNVLALERVDDETVSVTVRDFGHPRAILLTRSADAWSGACAWCHQPRCEHVFAASLAWIECLTRPDRPAAPSGLDRTTATALAASIAAPRKLTFRQQWETVLAEKLGRALTPEEGAFLGQLSSVFHNLRQSGRVSAWDLERLGLKIAGRRDPYHAYHGWWQTPPADPIELWQYLAFDMESSGGTVPEFLRPITDTTAIRERMKERQRRDAVERWNQHFQLLAEAADRPATVSPDDAAPEPLELRFRILPGAWRLETRPTAAVPWKTVSHAALLRLVSAKGAPLAKITAAPAVYAFLALCQEHLQSHYALNLDHGGYGAAAMLRRILQHPVARQLVVGEDGEPLVFANQPLVWELTRSAASERDYELALRLPDGSPLPPDAACVPGRPAFYIRGHTVYCGPPALDGNSAAGAIVPAETIERLATLRTLHRLGTKLPPEIAARFVSVPMRARIECELVNEVDAPYELFVLQLHALSAQPKIERAWTAHGWSSMETGVTTAGGKILTFDLSRPDAAAARIPEFKLNYDDYRKRWTRRVTRTLPDEFLAWRETLPADVEILATGELASLLDATVRASIDFNLIESPTHRDWFDLALALKPEDTTLTPEEIALLLKARGKLVRLPGKGWRRLHVEIEGAAAAALESAGFDRDTMAEAALAGEKQRFHALQLAQSGVAEALPEKQAAALRERAQEIARPAAPAIPAGLRAELRPYQKEGFEFLAFLSANRLGGILADDMGLGKTVQTLAWLLWLAKSRGHSAGRQHKRVGDREARPPALRALVVCPKSVVGNWEAEAAKFAPEIKVVRFSPKLAPGGGTGLPATDSETRDTGREPRATPEPESNGACLVVANYAQLRLHADYFTAQRWDAAILDEGQFIKTPTAKVAQIARELPGEHRLILTGTPIENRLLDLWSLFAFAVPGLLGSQAAFKRHFAQDHALALPRLRARVRHFLLRRTKAQVAADLPARTEEDVLVELEAEQQKLYQAELKRARAELLKVETARQFDQARFNILASLLRLRQICCHPALIDAAHRELPAAKLDDLLERVEELRDEGHQVLVFSQFVTMLELIRERLVAADIGHLILTGETENRDALVAEFQSDRTRTVFLLSLKAAGFGLNLTAASYVILYDPWWNPAVEAQAIDRTHRIGQSVPVIAYRLIARGTVEEKIRALQREKAALAGAIVQEESLASVLDLESLRRILG